MLEIYLLSIMDNVEYMIKASGIVTLVAWWLYVSRVKELERYEREEDSSTVLHYEALHTKMVASTQSLRRLLSFSLALFILTLLIPSRTGLEEALWTKVELSDYNEATRLLETCKKMRMPAQNRRFQARKPPAPP